MKVLRFMTVGGLALCLLSPRAALAAGFYVEAGDILTANYLGNKVVRVNPVSGAQESLGTFIAPTGLALTSAGDLYIGELGGDIKRLTITNGVVTVVNPASSLTTVRGLTLSTDGQLYVTGRNSGGDVVMKVNPVTGAESIVTQGDELLLPTGIEILDPDHLVVASFLNSSIVKVRISDGTQTVIASGGVWIDLPWGVAVSGDSIYAGHYDSKHLNRISATTGETSLLGTAPGYPYGLGLDGDGNLLVGAAGGVGQQDMLARIDPAGTLLATFNVGFRQQISGIEVAPTQIGSPPVNLPPVPASPVLERSASQGTKKRAAEFLGSDPEGDPLSLSSVAPASAHDGTVWQTAGWVLYSPPADYAGNDSFGFTVSDDQGGVSPGTATVIVRDNQDATLNVVVEPIGPDAVRVLGDGIPGRTYAVEFAEDTVPRVWQRLMLVTTDETGAFAYTDEPPAGAASRIYRAVEP